MNHNGAKCNMIPSNICAFKFGRAREFKERFQTPIMLAWNGTAILGRSAHALLDGLLENMAGCKKKNRMLLTLHAPTVEQHQFYRVLCCPPFVHWMLQLLTNWESQTTSPVVPWFFVNTNAIRRSKQLQHIPQLKKTRTDRGHKVCFDFFLQRVGVCVGFMPVLCLKCILETTALRESELI